MDIYDQLEQAVFVEQNYVRDRQYVVRDGEVVIVDEFTGRLAEGRKWRAGLHQAIEAREGLEISVETGEAARITIQDLFLRYDRLSGMTGTAASSANELRKIYSVRVIDVPTNKPPKRIQWPDLVFGSESQKWNAIADEIEAVHLTGRPVLVGTRSIDKSEMLSKLLFKRDIQHDVLNARNLAREAQIVAGAGHVSRVTVATNMAGRGTDIKISPPSLDLGGLHVICTEKAGRLLTHQSLPSKKLTRFAVLFRTAQNKIEQRHFRGRKMLLHQEKLRQEVQREMGQDPYLDTAGE